MASQQFNFPKRSKRFTIIAAVLVAIIILAFIAFNLFTEYIWMDSLSFGKVYTTILYSKVLLTLSGFILFFVLTFGTIYWIRLSYMNHFSHVQLPPVVTKGKFAYPATIFVSAVIGLIGSGIIQGIGWEPTLKLLNYASFDIKDPYFNMDVSFYVFVLPFVEFIFIYLT